MPMPINASGVSELIRRAEKHIKSGNLDRARDLLSNARSLEPSNEYIGAILERIALGERAPGTMTANKPAVPSQPAAENDLQRHVHRLTDDARSLYERGAYVTAFNTLMKAYLLDPVDQGVMQAEELIVPAFERVRQRGTLTSPAPLEPGTAEILRRHLAAGGAQDAGATALPGTASEAPGPGGQEPPKQRGGFFARFRKGPLPG
jgi:hypothetical protein